MIKTDAPTSIPVEQKPAPVDQDALNIEQLAMGVLNRDFRPRASSIRRLAEAVLTPAKPSSKSKKKRVKADKAGAKKKSQNKKRKLAKIPRQKGN